MLVYLFTAFLSGCSLPDPSLFQKGDGSLYEGGVSASELDSGDTGIINDTGNNLETGIDSGIPEDTSFEDTGEDTAMQDSGVDDSGASENSDDSGDTE